MSYAILVSTEARHHLARLSSTLRNQVLKQLDVLSEWATVLSMPSYFPFRDNCQLFLFDAVDEKGDEWDINVMFQYGGTRAQSTFWQSDSLASRVTGNAPRAQHFCAFRVMRT
jgi:hypothetical protein